MSRPSLELPGAATIHLDGVAVRVQAGGSVAAALMDAGITAFRRSTSGEPRGPMCGMGTCFECRVTIDGIAHRRACLVPVADGIRVSTIDVAAESPS